MLLLKFCFAHKHVGDAKKSKNHCWKQHHTDVRNPKAVLFFWRVYIVVWKTALNAKWMYRNIAPSDIPTTSLIMTPCKVLFWTKHVGNAKKRKIHYWKQHHTYVRRQRQKTYFFFWRVYCQVQNGLTQSECTGILSSCIIHYWSYIFRCKVQRKWRCIELHSRYWKQHHTYVAKGTKSTFFFWHLYIVMWNVLEHWFRASYRTSFDAKNGKHTHTCNGNNMLMFHREHRGCWSSTQKAPLLNSYDSNFDE